MRPTTRLHCEQLPARLNPVALDPTYYADGGAGLIPGFSGALVETEGDFDGNGSIDLAVAPASGSGGADRLVVYSGGEMNVPAVPSGEVVNGVPVMKTPGQGDVIFNGFLYDDTAGQGNVFRGGVDITTVRQGAGKPDMILAVPGVGGGDHVKEFTLDGSVDRNWSAFQDPDFRGGFRVDVSPETPNGPDMVFVTAQAGGAPRCAIFDQFGTEQASFFIGPQDDRSGQYTIDPTGILVSDPGNPSVYIFAVRHPGGQAVTLYGFDGTQYETFTGSAA